MSYLSFIIYQTCVNGEQTTELLQTSSEKLQHLKAAKDAAQKKTSTTDLADPSGYRDKQPSVSQGSSERLTDRLQLCFVPIRYWLYTSIPKVCADRILHTYPGCIFKKVCVIPWFTQFQGPKES